MRDEEVLEMKILGCVGRRIKEEKETNVIICIFMNGFLLCLGGAQIYMCMN